MNSRYARILENDVRRWGDLTQREGRVFMCLMFHKNERTGRCNPSRAIIMEFTGMSKSHLSEALVGLAFKKWIITDPEGYLFPDRKVPHSGTFNNNKVPHSGTKVPCLVEKVPHSGTLLNKEFKQRKQRINIRSIEGVVRDCVLEYPEKDWRLIEVGILQTLIRRNGSAEPINSIAYFGPEIETVTKTKLSSNTIDILLQRRREQYQTIIDV